MSERVFVGGIILIVLAGLVTIYSVVQAEMPEKSDLRPRVGDDPFQIRQGPILVTCECTEHAILVCTSRWSPERTSLGISSNHTAGPAPGIGLEPGLQVDWQGCRR